MCVDTHFSSYDGIYNANLFSGLKSFPSAIRYFSVTPSYLLGLSAVLQTHKNVLYMTAVGLIQRIDLVACPQGRQASLHHRLVTVMAN